MAVKMDSQQYKDLTANLGEVYVGVDGWFEKDEGERTPLLARKLLQQMFKLEILFKGDGYTYNEAGEQKSAEIMAESKPNSELDLVAIDGAFPWSD